MILSTLSIVTVTYQSASKLPDFLAAARTVAPEAEYVVVDNASADDTLRVARQHGAHQVLAGGSNAGFGRACNLGAECATGEWLLFANPDLLLEGIPPLVSPVSGSCGVVGAALAESDHIYRPSIRANTCLPEEMVAQLLYRLIPRGASWLAPQRRWPGQWASGALLLCHRDEFLKVGGFDRRFFLYFEDRDLARRYRLDGYPVRFDRRLRGRHGHGESSPGVDAWRREAWSLTSWIEYRGIWHGTAAARHTARLTLATLSSIRWLGERLGNSRARRKAAEAAEILAFLSDLQRQLVDGGDYHPLAQAALSEALSQRNDQSAPLSCA